MLCILLCDISQQLHYAYILLKLWFLWSICYRNLMFRLFSTFFMFAKKKVTTVTTAIIYYKECNHCAFISCFDVYTTASIHTMQFTSYMYVTYLNWNVLGTSKSQGIWRKYTGSLYAMQQHTVYMFFCFIFSHNQRWVKSIIAVIMHLYPLLYAETIKGTIRDAWPYITAIPAGETLLNR